MIRAATLLALLALAACSDPPCPTDEGAHKAGEAFGQCVRLQQQGDGGLICGQAAYRTFCKRRPESTHAR